MVSYLDPTGTPTQLASVGFTGRNWDQPANIVRGHRTMSERMPSAVLHPGATIEIPSGEALNLHAIKLKDPLFDRLLTLPELLDRRLQCDGLLVMKDGNAVAEHYANGMNESDLHVVHSCTKTLTTMMVGIAAEAGKLDPMQPIVELIPELAEIAAWNDVLIQHILDMAAGIESDEHYELVDSMYWRYADAVGYYEPTALDRQIGALNFVVSDLTVRSSPPGTVFNYASYLTNLLAISVGRAYQKDPCELYETFLYQRIGAEGDALLNIDRFGVPIVEGQLNLTLRDFARWAYLYANDGRSLNELQVVPERWVNEVFASSGERAAAFERSEYANAMSGSQYHNQLWQLDPQNQVVAMLGIHGQFAYIDRPRGLLIAGMSSFPDQVSPLMFATMRNVWSAITAELD